MPAKAGIQNLLNKLDSRLRGNDTKQYVQIICGSLSNAAYGNLRPALWVKSDRNINGIILLKI